jgi:hypothetical protein
MQLYKTVERRFFTSHSLSKSIWSTIRVKRERPLSPTLFRVYIDELKQFIKKSTQGEDGCLLHQVLNSLLTFIDYVVLLASTLEGLQRKLDVLGHYCDLWQLTVNLGNQDHNSQYNQASPFWIPFFQKQPMDITTS